MQQMTTEGSPGAPAADIAGPGSAAATKPKRWALAVLVGAGAGLPLGWLLCYGALLPFFLGLFFFLLFGLLLGAVIYRVGAPARPMPRGRLVLGTAVVAFVTWAVSIAVEGYDFPRQMADKAIGDHRKLPEGTATAEEFRRESAEQVARYLREHYAPGGVIGYIRWAVSSGRLERGVGQLRRPYQASQPRGWWVLRVLLSIGLLGFGIHSQVGSLTRMATEKDRASTAVNPLSKM